MLWLVCFLELAAALAASLFAVVWLNVPLAPCLALSSGQGKAPMSSSEARGTLFGALGGAEAGKDAGKQQAPPPQQQQQLMQQAQLGQLPLLYAAQPGAAGAPFMMPPGFPGVLPPGVADGSAPAEGAPAPAQPEAQA